MFTHAGANWNLQPKDVQWNSAEAGVIQQVQQQQQQQHQQHQQHQQQQQQQQQMMMSLLIITAPFCFAGAAGLVFLRHRV
jgi:membrane protein insertase Oxa1/YidC/SpoIIIJ